MDDYGESDWLGLRSNLTLNGKVLNRLDVSTLTPFSESLEIDPLGLAGYWASGYSVFGSTPWSGVRISPHEIRAGSGGAELPYSDDDPLSRFLEIGPASENELFTLLRDLVQERFSSSSEIIVLPLSGGLDSRLLLWAVRGIPRDRIRAYTYGSSFPQHLSREVLTAKSLAESESVEWRFIQLGDVNRHAQKVWPIHKGFSHIHGMYHYDFYNQIRSHLGEHRAVVLSGSVGDAWAGSIPSVQVSKPSDLAGLLLSHQLRGSRGGLPGCKKNFTKLLHREFEINGPSYRDPVFNVVQVIRQKMSLLRYLHEVPESLGFEVFAPFHNQGLALNMLRLKPERRHNRKWQREFLSSQFPSVSPDKGSTSNSLNFQFLMSGQIPLALRGSSARVFDGSYLSQVERGISQEAKLIRANLTRAGGSIKSSLLIRSGQINPSLWAYIQSLMLYPFFENTTSFPVEGD